MTERALGPWIASLIGKKIADIKPFEQAFTHGSHGNADYQRLEFLGDRVLGLVMSQALYSKFPKEPEGQLSRRLNSLVAGSTCAAVGRDLKIGPYIRLGKQARDDGADDSDNVLGDVIEALIGAIYLSFGLEQARQFIESSWGERIVKGAEAPKHPKSALQEWTASNRKKGPVYEVVGKSGPHHSLRFNVKVSVNMVGEVVAEGSSKQDAETKAATMFMEKYT